MLCSGPWEAAGMLTEEQPGTTSAVPTHTCVTSTFDSPDLIKSKEAGVTSAVSKAPCSFVLITMSNCAPLACVCY